MKHFNLVKTRGKIAFCDDDRSAAEAIALSMDRLFDCEPVNSIDDAKRMLSESDAALVRQDAILAKLLYSNQGVLEIPLVAQWLSSREKVVEVFFSDYEMGYANGIELFSGEAFLNVRKVLFSGVIASETLAAAFSRGDIDHFLPKNDRNPKELYVDYARRGAKHHFTFAPAESGEEIAHLFGQQSFLESLESELERLQCVEYVFLASKFGFVARTATGRVVWLQITTGDSLKDLPEQVDRRVSIGEFAIATELFLAFPSAYQVPPISEAVEFFDEPWASIALFDISRLV